MISEFANYSTILLAICVTKLSLISRQLFASCSHTNFPQEGNKITDSYVTKNSPTSPIGRRSVRYWLKISNTDRDRLTVRCYYVLFSTCVGIRSYPKYVQTLLHTCTALHCTALHCTALHCTAHAGALEYIINSNLSGILEWQLK